LSILQKEADPNLDGSSPLWSLLLWLELALLVIYSTNTGFGYVTCIQYMDQLFLVYHGLLICIFTCKKWCNHPTFSLSNCSLTWTQRSWLSCRNTCHLTTTRTMKLQPKPSHYGMARWCKVTSPFLGGYKFCHLSNFGAQNFLQSDSSLCFLFTDTRTKAISLAKNDTIRRADNVATGCKFS